MHKDRDRSYELASFWTQLSTVGYWLDDAVTKAKLLDIPDQALIDALNAARQAMKNHLETYRLEAVERKREGSE